MDKQQQNIQRVVAAQALKDIHKIVEKDRIKENQEKNGAVLVGALILFFIIIFLGSLLLE